MCTDEISDLFERGKVDEAIQKMHDHPEMGGPRTLPDDPVERALADYEGGYHFLEPTKLRYQPQY